jgi:hypothetical protein
VGASASEEEEFEHAALPQRAAPSTTTRSKQIIELTLAYRHLTRPEAVGYDELDDGNAIPASSLMKSKTVYTCQECGAQSAKWLGRCVDCGAWNSLVEERPVPAAVAAGSAEKRYALASAAGPQLYSDIDTVVAERLSSGIEEFDRVLGGGVVPGSLVLIGGVDAAASVGRALRGSRRPGVVLLRRGIGASD